MNYSRHAPTSLVRSSTATIATYDTYAFISANPISRESPLPRATPPRRTVRAGLLSAVFVALAILLAAGAARADTVKPNNQATIARFTDKVTFGALQPARIEGTVNRALARLSAIEDKKAQVRTVRSLGPIPTIAKVHLP